MFTSGTIQARQPDDLQIKPSVIALNNVSKRFGPQTPAVNGLSLTMHASQFLALLGPSGCGKSTTLRLIAGLETPDTGEIWLAEACVASERSWVPPDARRVGLVFQDYALFPHLTVGENIAFPLQRSNAQQRRIRIDELTELVGMAGMAGRYPHQISGGQQQRVALARALAADPTVVLLDEPFSNLDTVLRSSMRAEVHAILSRAHATTILVTHDQEEAFSLADTVAVMFNGTIVQIGTPQEIYLRPATREVATFVGAARFLIGEADNDTVSCALGTLPLAQPALGQVAVLLRPDALMLQFADDGMARVTDRRFFGAYQSVGLQLADGSALEARLAPHVAVNVHAPCAISVLGPVMAYPLG
ncbi:MAG: ABC transporter ATP-binding protein [Chloroflexales bacterium]|nr:ABC transporter ATP-binding protein [Chloroflexales bacterium]